MDKIKVLLPGLLYSVAVAIPAHLLGKKFPIAGGAVIAILMGMLINVFYKPGKALAPGVKFASKTILQAAVVLLGFGLNLSVVVQIGVSSLPIIMSTIATSLLVAYVMHKALKVDGQISTLIGVGTSICGGSAVAATAPVIDADDEKVAQAISVIFFFNVLAAIFFPTFGNWIGIPHVDGEAFGLFAATAVNDTSSVTATASTWDTMHNLGSQTLNHAVTVKLTRTLFIIPITVGLAFIRGRKGAEGQGARKEKFNIKKAVPLFIGLFVLASLATTIVEALSVPYAHEVFGFFKSASKFFIVWAMAAIGLNTDVVKLVKTGGKPILLGFTCWVAVTAMGLLMMKLTGVF
ncbi:MAG: YeiH family protein [Bacillota bacterium]|nr:YeiH family protein [Bacillota bacterium]